MTSKLILPQEIKPRNSQWGYGGQLSTAPSTATISPNEVYEAWPMSAAKVGVGMLTGKIDPKEVWQGLKSSVLNPPMKLNGGMTPEQAAEKGIEGALSFSPGNLGVMGGLLGRAKTVGQGSINKPIRFEVGKSLTNEERKQVLDSIGDAYRENQAPRELKYIDSRTGEEVWGYAYSPDSMYMSDITDKKIRHYINLPDGRKAHPSELFPEIKESDIEKHLSEQVYKEKMAEQTKKDSVNLISNMVAEDIQSANIKFNQANKNAIGGVFDRVQRSILLEKDGSFVRIQSDNPLKAALEMGFKIKARGPKSQWADEIIKQ